MAAPRFAMAIAAVAFPDQELVYGERGRLFGVDVLSLVYGFTKTMAEEPG